jgi:hypothetical protein
MEQLRIINASLKRFSDAHFYLSAKHDVPGDIASQ